MGKTRALYLPRRSLTSGQAAIMGTKRFEESSGAHTGECRQFHLHSRYGMNLAPGRPKFPPASEYGVTRFQGRCRLFLGGHDEKGLMESPALDLATGLDSPAPF